MKAYASDCKAAAMIDRTNFWAVRMRFAEHDAL